ncbi:2OG-Fe(II) oxygenase [Pseudohalocynthiibacter aestuariivivens]|uniref:2OG-Fe(II) oxygenase n=1 Tax=Roseovarius pelagicus TaxID=2980108 RepID=A0ABY6DA72_9RHOB|nr:MULTISPECIES: 2OG-Fe(II) oxygenase [Rhodobacterales]QIE45043.1 2OG-Fe(II) oxygenase [Pseudohalocynthiibacter aestuariivivens]UXX83036.1 2OG-Fe(II) oxygenase [Roseovarius pelagicus]
MRPEDVVNLDAYPILDRSDPARTALVERLRQELEENQFVSLPDFILPAAREQAVADAMEARGRAHHNNSNRNCYLHRTGDPSLPDDHPRNIMLSASTKMIAYDRFSDQSPVKLLYHWEPVRQMVAEIVGVEKLYDNEDPCQPVNLLCYETGDRSAWHFDSVNAFTMTLMLQAAEVGGEFEMVPNTRTDDDQNYDYVGRVVTGQCPEDAVAVAREAGALCIFRGCNSLHRVSPVVGDTTRVMGVFVYENEPGIVGDPEVNATVYGEREAVAG